MDAPVTKFPATAVEAEAIRTALRGLQRIETRRAIMAPLADGDLNELTDLLRDERVSKPNYIFEQPFSLAAADRRIRQSQQMQAAGDTVYLPIRLKEGNYMVGEANISVTPEYQAAEFGGVLATHMWGSGLAEEGAIAIMDWLVDVVGIKLIMVTTARDNTPSERVIRELGMRFVENRDCKRLDGTLRPSIYFEQTADEWRVFRPNLLERMERMTRFALYRDRKNRAAIPGLEVKSA